jgi:hypothetical protein
VPSSEAPYKPKLPSELPTPAATETSYNVPLTSGEIVEVQVVVQFNEVALMAGDVTVLVPTALMT